MATVTETPITVMGRTRKNHPDFNRDEYQMGTTPEAGDWYVGMLFTGRSYARPGREAAHPDRGLNYFDGDEWVRLPQPVDKTFQPS